MAMVASRAANSPPSQRLSRLAIASSLSMLLFAPLAAAQPYQVIARTGSPTPFGDNAFYHQFLTNSLLELPRPRLAQQGPLCFYAVLAGPAVLPSDRLTVTRDNARTLDAVWRQGHDAPGLPPGVLFTGISRLTMNGQGDISFFSSLSGPDVVPGINDRGVWLASAIGTSLIIREGAPIALPGLPEASMSWLSNAQATDPGDFGSVVVTGDVDIADVGSGLEAIIVQTPAGLDVAMLAGTQLPDAPPSTFIFLTTPVVGPSGIGAYQCTLTGAGVETVTVNGITIVTDRALVAGFAPDFTTIARSGHHAPTEAPGVVFWTVWGGAARSALSRTGSIVFTASLAGPGVSTANWWGVWKHSRAGLSRIARLGATSPIPNTSYASFSLMSGATILAISNTDAVIHSALILGSGVTTSSNGVIVYDDGESRRIIARAGVDLPALPAGTRLQNSTFGPGVKIGPRGHAAIAAKLEGTAVTPATDVAILLWSPDAADPLRLICRKGDIIGDHRILTTSQTGADLQVNALGQITFSATVVRVDDPALIPRAAILAAAPGLPARILAVEGGSLPLAGEELQLRTLRMSADAALNDQGRVAFVVAAGPITTIDEAVILATVEPPTPPCPADHDASGTLDAADIFAFLSDWFAGDADFDLSGQTEVPDIFVYLSAWFAGCPS